MQDWLCTRCRPGQKKDPQHIRCVFNWLLHFIEAMEILSQYFCKNIMNTYAQAGAKASFSEV